MDKLFPQHRARKKKFQNFQSKLPRDFLTAHIVSTAWHSFSKFMPWFLCTAASLVSTNLARHYVIQTAFEELGMRDNNQIHADIFWSAANSIGITAQNYSVLDGNGKVKSSLNFLKKSLLSYSCDMQIFGILLGLEIPAIENIETIYTSMSYSEFATKALDNHLFFILHREVEVEHVRLTVSNFLRFQKSKQDQQDFVHGFMDGINFWEIFWSSVKNHLMTHRK